jgi:hypothetical protein
VVCTGQCTLCSRFTLHQRHDVIRTAGSARSTSTILNRQGLWNQARVPNPPDCADPGLHPDRRRDDATNRPNTGRTAATVDATSRTNTGRTAAWASMEGRHLLHGFFGRLQPRCPVLPAAAASHGSLRKKTTSRPEIPSTKRHNFMVRVTIFQVRNVVGTVFEISNPCPVRPSHR